LEIQKNPILKMAKSFDPRISKVFECILLENSTTNS